ncbi:MAG: metallophosphoesterase [Pseudomonadota bacterium]
MEDPIYAIGDVHGQLAALKNALALIEADGGSEAQIVLLGDYVDRGPDSRGVVELLMQARTNGRPWIMLKGNHDRYLVRFLSEARVSDPRTSTGLKWLNPRLGGDKTLCSYGVKAAEDMPIGPLLEAARTAVPSAHTDFLNDLPLVHEAAGKLFVHAGIRPGVPLDAQKEDDLLWIRDGFLDHTGSFGPLVVHGHTSLEAPEHYGNRVNLDGGAGYFRPLHPAVIEGSRVWLLTEAGRIELRPR